MYVVKQAGKQTLTKKDGSEVATLSGYGSWKKVHLENLK